MPEAEESMRELYDLLVQAALFSETGISTQVAMQYMGVSRGTLSKFLNKIPGNLLQKTQKGRTNFYSINIEQLENI